MIELDYTNVLDAAVGEHGIAPDSFERAAESGRKAVDAIAAAHTSGALGFADLPFDDRAVKEVQHFVKQRDLPVLLVLGIGGSALGPAALDAARAKGTGPDVLDVVSPVLVG